MAHVASSLLPDRPMELQRECQPCSSPNMLRFSHIKQHKTTPLGELGIHTIRKACEAILVQDLGFDSLKALFLPAPCRKKMFAIVCSFMQFYLRKKTSVSFQCSVDKGHSFKLFLEDTLQNTHKTNLSRLLVNCKFIKPKIEKIKKMIENGRAMS